MENAPLAAQVFKTIVDPYIGRLSIMKVLKGKMKADSVVYNMNQEKDEKITQLLVLNGKEQQSVPEVFAGDITAVTKLANTSTSDTLGVKAETEIWPAIAFPEPTLSIAIEPKRPASPAMARARSVLPVPGEPASKTPFGIRPPRRVNF